MTFFQVYIKASLSSLLFFVVGYWTFGVAGIGLKEIRSVFFRKNEKWRLYAATDESCQEGSRSTSKKDI